MSFLSGYIILEILDTNVKGTWVNKGVLELQKVKTYSTTLMNF